VNPVANPYSPGAGTRPHALVGRDRQLEEMSVSLQRLLRRKSARSQLLTGLRGVGKTVLLNAFEEEAARLDFGHEHIEIDEDGELLHRLVGSLRSVILQLDNKRRIGEAAKRALGVLKAFSLTLPGGSSIGFEVEAVSGPADRGDLPADLSGLFVELGQLAMAHETGVLITIDELHYVPLPLYAALISGLHRANQLTLPVTIAGAGLPSLPALSGEARSYAERMFEFPVVGSVSHDATHQALIDPAKEEGIQWEIAALDRVWDLTGGYPYFIQEFGKHAWDLADEQRSFVTFDDVERSIPLSTAKLDEGFFRVRTGKLSPGERVYLRAMAELGPGPAKSSDVAGLLGKKTAQLGTIRESLIRRALCYSSERNEIAFTVPLFDQFMRRWMPEFPSPA
jgi:hypothetical protein